MELISPCEGLYGELVESASFLIPQEKIIMREFAFSNLIYVSTFNVCIRFIFLVKLARLLDRIEI